MAQEIIYTSAPQGLRPGTYGFCTVAITAGMPASLVEELEALSGYRHLFPPGTPEASRNPVVYSHVVLKINTRRVHVMSRIADAGLDYSQRSNKLAHHVALDDNETPSGGPACLASQPGFLEHSWTGSPRMLPLPRRVPLGTLSPQVCHAWERLTGDAGWAGVLAQHAYDGRRPAYVIVPEGADSLALLREAQALLPERKRWDVSFSTCYTKMPAGVDCLWRCVIAGTPEADAALALRGDLVIDASRRLGPAPDGRLVTAARTGQVPSEPTRPVGPLLAAPPEPAPVQRPARPAASSAPLVIEDEFAVGPPPMPSGSMPPPPPPPKAIAPPALKRRRSWGKVVSVAAVLLVLVGVGIAGYYSYNNPQVAELVPDPNGNQSQNAEPAPVGKEVTSEIVPEKQTLKVSLTPQVNTSPASEQGEPQEDEAGTEDAKSGSSNRLSPDVITDAAVSKASDETPDPPKASSRNNQDLTTLLRHYPLTGPIKVPPSGLTEQEPTLLWSLPPSNKVLSLAIYGPNNDTHMFSIRQENDSKWILSRTIYNEPQDVGEFVQKADEASCTIEYSWLIQQATGDHIVEQLNSCVLEAIFSAQTIRLMLSEPRKIEEVITINKTLEKKHGLKGGKDLIAVVHSLDGIVFDKHKYTAAGSLSQSSKLPHIGVKVEMKTYNNVYSAVIEPSVFSFDGRFAYSVKGKFDEAKTIFHTLVEYENNLNLVSSLPQKIKELEESHGKERNEDKKGALKKQLDDAIELLRESKGAVKKLENDYVFLASSDARNAIRSLTEKWSSRGKGQGFPRLQFIVYRVLLIPEKEEAILIPELLYGDVEPRLHVVPFPQGSVN